MSYILVYEGAHYLSKIQDPRSKVETIQISQRPEKGGSKWRSIYSNPPFTEVSPSRLIKTNHKVTKPPDVSVVLVEDRSIKPNLCINTYQSIAFHLSQTPAFGHLHHPGLWTTCIVSFSCLAPSAGACINKDFAFERSGQPKAASAMPNTVPGERASESHKNKGKFRHNYQICHSKLILCNDSMLFYIHTL